MADAAPARLGDRPVDAVLLDYGFTLVTFSRPDASLRSAHDEIRRRLLAAGAGPVPSAEVLLQGVHDRVEMAVERHESGGVLRELDVVSLEREAYADLGLRLPSPLLDEVAGIAQRAWWDGVVVGAGVPATLAALRRGGLRLALCSNAPYRPASIHAQIHHLGLAALLDGATFSSEVGWRKPAAPIFAACAGALGVPAERCVMVGDRRREDVAGARSAGMATVRTREHRDDPGEDDADVVIDHLSQLPRLLFGAATEGAGVVASGDIGSSRRTR